MTTRKKKTDTPRRSAPPLLLEGTPAAETPAPKKRRTPRASNRVQRRVTKRRDAIAPYKPSSSPGDSVAGSSVTLAPEVRSEGESRSSGASVTGSSFKLARLVKLGTIEDLRALDQAKREHFVDFITSGAPISSVRTVLESEHGLRFTEDAPVVQFYQEEARRRWQNTYDTASADADAMINVLRHSDLDFSEALLKALGQQAFRMITQRELNTKQVEKFTRLLLQARGQDVSRNRAKEALALQREKMERQFQSDLEKALNALADEIKAHPEVRESFVFFRAKLKEAMRAKAKKLKTEESAEGGRSADYADLHRFKAGEENQTKEIPSENLRSSAKSADGSLPS